MIFQLLTAVISLVLILHGLGPNTPRHTADHTVFSIHTIAEKEGKVGGKLINMHAPAQIIFYICKSIGQGKCQLCNGIGARFCNMITTDTNAVKVAYFLLYKIFL